jgi:hypothetical protein
MDRHNMRSEIDQLQQIMMEFPEKTIILLMNQLNKIYSKHIPIRYRNKFERRKSFYNRVGNWLAIVTESNPSEQNWQRLERFEKSALEIQKYLNRKPDELNRQS